MMQKTGEAHIVNPDVEVITCPNCGQVYASIYDGCPICSSDDNDS